MKLDVVASHPIQYQAPLFRALAAHPDIDLHVHFCADDGARRYHDAGFGRQIQWDVPLLSGYPHAFLPNWSARPNASRFWGVVNPGIVRALRARKPDALLLQGWSRATEWIAYESARAMGIPILLRAESNLLRQPTAWKARAKNATMRHLLAGVDRALAIGSLNAAFYRHHGLPEERIRLAPYAVDNDFFRGLAAKHEGARADVRRALGLPEDAPIVLFVGKLIPAKAPLDLLRAFERVAGSGAALVFVGDGPQRAELEAHATAAGLDRVRFAGFRNQTELPAFYAAADVFVLPSVFETWGLVVNEAMCFDLPIVVSDLVGSGADLVREGENGHRFPARDVGALAERLRGLLADPAARKAMGRRSGEIVSAWSFRENVDAIVAAVREVKEARR